MSLSNETANDTLNFMYERCQALQRRIEELEIELKKVNHEKN